MKTSEVGILQNMSLDKSAKILDWGCGVGRQIDAMRLSGFVDVQGLDVDPIHRREGILIESDSVGFLERHSQDYDVIFARESVYYIPKDGQQRLWNAFHTALRPGGKLVVVAFNGALCTSEWILQKDYGIKLSMNEVSLYNLAHAAGFSDIQISGIKVTHRTPIGHFVGACTAMYRNLNNRILYLSERGLDPANPRHYTKSLALVAGKE